jgi:hypothetical protein
MAPKTELRRITTIRPAQPVIRSAYACLDDRGMAMARVTVEVPSELVAPIRETVLLLYEATAESLHLSLRAHSEGRGSPRELHDHRVRLAQLDDLLRQLGWPAGGRWARRPRARPARSSSRGRRSCSTTRSTAR